MPTLQEQHFAIVTNIDDPEKRGRIKVRCQSLVGADVELPDWIEPGAQLISTLGGGSLWLPSIDSTVVLQVDAADTHDDVPGERFLQNPAIKWLAATPTDPNGPQSLPEALRTNYPFRRGFRTPGGHEMWMDEKGSLMIKSKDNSTIEFTSSGQIVLKSPVLMGIGATELMILGNAFMTLYNAHSHATGVGPSGPPIVQMTTAQLSQEGNKVK